ncbi:pilus assembly protein [Phenylobacterium sp. J426]|uniref:TadE/TadG family type IV pilus assembly protein n=1 Tax=Phenylobacterium sp. J426 TaxID=2898439 RepID=UPI002151F384|nr:TadE/TadG family type IV pilus assembly protein [Phenylobacterium sp. J426]MCR5876677.1 pilus assembly protein [Phenylobacterium sp. J426]
MPSPKDRERGAVALEFAVLAPFLVLLIVGAIRYALYLSVYLAVVHATSEGARASVGGATSAQRLSLAQARVADVLASYGALVRAGTATVTAVADPMGPNTYRVRVTYDVRNLDFGPDWVPLPNGGTQIAHSVSVANGWYGS